MNRATTAAPIRDLPPFFRGLAAAALADWLITRTLTRSAIFMPKSPPIIAVYQSLTLVGQAAFTLASLLALVVVGWIMLQHLRLRREFGLPLVLLGLLVLNLLFLIIPPDGWLVVGDHLLVVAAAGMMGWAAWRGPGNLKHKMAWSAPALALLAGELRQLNQALLETLHRPGPPPLAAVIFNLGELFAVMSPVVVWWAFRGDGRETAGVTAYVWAALPAAALTVAHAVAPATTAIITIWSVGLTLYLPWPLYAVSVWLAGAVVILLRRSAPAVGWALLLLAAGGYAPQMSHQLFLNLIALWLLAQPAAAYSMPETPQPLPQLPASIAQPQAAAEVPQP